ncbi:Choline/ethanolaminephosphotransferase 2 (Aminoalcohol phosphotransferase 2) (AtAAPT2) [Durusdinium trenchii]|uniref:Choline/ethanolaminephosphotransferase 2 (Aminoalcohol phosphotransferase 2) (AtAAPT2) n=1 Tax=Durusdinium trenchii TaxID=1381693 RepID=A0ABP0S584_9DINO
MYTYFCSPLADALVRLMPTWLAPNTITFLGLAFSIAGYILVHIYAPTFKEPCPSWLWLVLAACTFAYQTLDNIDGKQARRTNSSSALGLFIDHGADALNIILTSQNAMALLQLGQRETCWATLAIWTATSTPFFFATWEEHFTGSLYLGLFNGPTDGVLIVCASYVVTALSSPGFWSGQCVLGMSRAECMIFFYLVCVFFTVSANIYSVQQKLSSSRHLGAGLSLTIPFLLHLLFGYWMLGPLHPTETNTRLSLWFLGFCFLILVSALQLANVCGERYKPWRWTLTVLACLWSCPGPSSAVSLEEVYHVPGEPDAHACEIYGSCVLYRTFSLAWLALDLSFSVAFSRDGTGCQWSIGGTGGEAELVTIMSTRDGSRLPSGLVAPSLCEVEKTGPVALMSVDHLLAMASVGGF